MRRRTFAKEELLNHAIELFQIIRVERDRREKFGSRKLCPIIIDKFQVCLKFAWLEDMSNDSEGD